MAKEKKSLLPMPTSKPFKRPEWVDAMAQAVNDIKKISSGMRG